MNTTVLDSKYRRDAGFEAKGKGGVLRVQDVAIDVGMGGVGRIGTMGAPAEGTLFQFLFPMLFFYCSPGFKPEQGEIAQLFCVHNRMLPRGDFYAAVEMECVVHVDDESWAAYNTVYYLTRKAVPDPVDPTLPEWEFTAYEKTELRTKERACLLGDAIERELAERGYQRGLIPTA